MPNLTRRPNNPYRWTDGDYPDILDGLPESQWLATLDNISPAHARHLCRLHMDRLWASALTNKRNPLT